MPDSDPPLSKSIIDDYNFPLFDILKSLWRGKWWIFFFSALGIFGAVYKIAISTPVYVSETTFFPISAKSVNMNLGELSEYASVMGLKFQNPGAGGVNYEAIMLSRDFSTRIVKKLNLYPLLLPFIYDKESGERLPLEEIPIAKGSRVLQLLGHQFRKDWSIEELDQFLLSRAVTFLKNSIDISIKKDLHSVKVYGVDPKLSAEIANAYIAELERYLQKKMQTSARRSLRFIEKQLVRTEREKNNSEEKLKNFSEKHGVFTVKNEASVLYDAIGKVRGQIALVEVELATKKNFLNTNSPQLDLERAKLKALKTQLKHLEQGNATPHPGSSSLNMSKDRIPKLALEYERLKSEVSVQLDIYKQLRTHLELTRIDEARESETIQVIDRAVSSEYPVEPEVWLLLMIGLLSGFGLGGMIAFLRPSLKNMRQEWKRKNQE